MVHLGRIICLWLAFTVVISTVAPVPDAYAAKKNDRKKKNRRNGGRSTKAKQASITRDIERVRAAGEAALQRAANAKSKNESARRQVETFISHVRSLENQLDNASASLRALQEEIENSQGEDSELQDRYEDLTAAKEKVATAKKNLFESADYKAAYQRAAASRNRATELPRLRREAIERDQPYRDAVAELSYAQEQLELVQMKLYQADPDWKNAVESNRAAREELASAMRTFENGLLSKVSSAAAHREAMAIASRASTLIQQGNASLERLKSKERSNSNSRNRSRNR